MTRASLFPQPFVHYGTIRLRGKGDNKQNPSRAPLYRAAFCHTRGSRQRNPSRDRLRPISHSKENRQSIRSPLSMLPFRYYALLCLLSFKVLISIANNYARKASGKPFETCFSMTIGIPYDSVTHPVVRDIAIYRGCSGFMSFDLRHRKTRADLRRFPALRVATSKVRVRSRARSTPESGRCGPG
jgi:hypothetical protein